MVFCLPFPFFVFECCFIIDPSFTYADQTNVFYSDQMLEDIP